MRSARLLFWRLGNHLLIIRPYKYNLDLPLVIGFLCWLIFHGWSARRGKRLLQTERKTDTAKICVWILFPWVEFMASWFHNIIWSAFSYKFSLVSYACTILIYFGPLLSYCLFLHTSQKDACLRQFMKYQSTSSNIAPSVNNNTSAVYFIQGNPFKILCCIFQSAKDHDRSIIFEMIKNHTLKLYIYMHY